jgi:MFS family permease
LAVVTTLAALPGQRLFGVLVDRWGPRRVQLITGLAIPLVPWAWALARSPWQLVPVDMFAGFLWAGFGLASFSFLLAMIPEDRRSRYSALYQIVVTLGLAAGSALGGIIATRWGLVSVFVVSGFGRLVAALVFARFVPQLGLDVNRPKRHRQLRRRRLAA